MLKSRRINLTVICLIAFVVGIFLFVSFYNPVIGASAEESHTACEGYCLVCDLAGKINALPASHEITADNLAETIQQINDIDRIKFNLTDEQFYELTTLVETHDDGVDSNVITRYASAVDKARELSGSGVNLVIAKSFYLENEVLSDTSSAEVSFSVKNVASGAVTELKLFDLSTSTSALGEEFYGLTAEGWRFGYVLPKGEYVIEETNLDKPITINGSSDYYHCVSVTDGVNEVAGNSITVTLGDEPVSVLFSNSKCENINGVPTEGEKESYITYDCNVCGEASAKYIIIAPEGAVYDGVSTYTVSTRTETLADFHFETADGVAEITYEFRKYDVDSWTSVAESETYKAGHYKATLTLSGVSTSVEYEVNYPAPKILFTSAPGGLTYGSVSGDIGVLIKEEEGMRYEYLWYDNENNVIEGETNYKYTLPTDLSAGAYIYTVEVRCYDALDSSSEPMYSSIFETIAVNVDKRLAIVVVDDQQSEYGEDQVALTSSINGISSYDTPESVYELSCEVDSYSTPGSYVITSTIINENYDITFFAGTYTVSKRYLDLSIADLTSEYGEDLLDIDYTIDHGTIANGASEEEIFNVYCDADPYIPGSYEIYVECLDDNYEIFYATSVYTVNTKKVSVTFGDDREFIYNASYQHPSYVCSDPEAVPVIHSANNVGTHTATVVGFTSEIYELEAPASVEYEILPTSITIKADDLSKQVGDIDPKLTFSITGMVYGNYGFKDLVLSREEGEAVGDYEIYITVDESQNVNYDITLVGGVFKIYNSLAGLSAEFDELKANLDEALQSKASTEELEKAISDLEKAIKKAEEALGYAEADEKVKNDLLTQIEDVKAEILDAVKNIARDEVEKELGANQGGEGNDIVEAPSNDSTMLLITVASMGGVTVVMLIFLIVLFAKRLGKK